jgi:hypothetical protein
MENVKQKRINAILASNIAGREVQEAIASGDIETIRSAQIKWGKAREIEKAARKSI